MPISPELDAKLDALAAQVEKLAAREQIRSCLYRINRGMDRIDGELMASGFFADAKVLWGTPEPMDFDTWFPLAMAMQQKTKRAQHLIGNVLIDLRGNEADVESYEIGRHLTPMGGEMKDLIIAARYIDRFVRREGEWRIIHREKVPDWIRIMEGSDPYFDSVPVPGRRDGQDVSFKAFGADAFHDQFLPGGREA